jgi:hypothetical protein
VRERSIAGTLDTAPARNEGSAVMEGFAMILADGGHSSSGGILLILLVLAIAWVLTAR